MAARMLTDSTINKEMALSEALRWLRGQNIDAIVSSQIVRADIRRALANATPTAG